MYDLKNQEAKDAIYDLSKPAFNKLKKAAQLTNFAGTSELSFDGTPVVFVGDCVFVVNSGVVHYLGAIYYGSSMYGCDNANEGAEAVVLPKGKRKKENKSAPFLIVNNGDNPTGDYAPVECHPTLSFQCVAQLLEIKGTEDEQTNEAAKLFVNGTLRIIDYTFDDRIRLTKEEKMLFKKNKKLKAPLGYTLVGGDEWHCSSTVLFCDVRTEKFYLCGQDEGSYYGVELVKGVKTIRQAFNALTPKDARVKGTQRQGEWFIVPVKTLPFSNTKGIPSHTIPVMKGDLVLPKDHPDSHDHTVDADRIVIIPEVSPRSGVYAQGKQYTGCVCHDDHEEVGFDGWVTFIHNLARKSVSVEGVD